MPTPSRFYFLHMRTDPANPGWQDRDRLVLSKGHTAPALYGALALSGFFPVEEIPTLRHIDSHLQGHPDMKGTPGVDMSTGSLGQGISAAVGMALAAKLDGSDEGFCHSGTASSRRAIWERLPCFATTDLCLIIDNNHLQIDGTVEESTPISHSEKFVAFGFNVITIDGRPRPDRIGADRCSGI